MCPVAPSHRRVRGQPVRSGHRVSSPRRCPARPAAGTALRSVPLRRSRCGRAEQGEAGGARLAPHEAGRVASASRAKPRACLCRKTAQNSYSVLPGKRSLPWPEVQAKERCHLLARRHRGRGMGVIWGSSFPPVPCVRPGVCRARVHLRASWCCAAQLRCGQPEGTCQSYGRTHFKSFFFQVW